MEIGIIQRNDQATEIQRRQRAQEVNNNACVVYHTNFCRPWKCQRKGKVNKINNQETWMARHEPIYTIAFDDAVDSEE